GVEYRQQVIAFDEVVQLGRNLQEAGIDLCLLGGDERAEGGRHLFLVEGENVVLVQGFVGDEIGEGDEVLAAELGAEDGAQTPVAGARRGLPKHHTRIRGRLEGDN